MENTANDDDNDTNTILFKFKGIRNERKAIWLQCTHACYSAGKWYSDTLNNFCLHLQQTYFD